MTFAIVVFWACVAIAAWAYAVMPLLVLVRGHVLARPYEAAEVTPTVSVVIAAYNEASVIEAKLANIAASDYPADAIEIVVASDGSDDGTDELVRRARGRNVTLLSLPRGGKAAALNRAVAAARNDVLVFTDANSMLEPGALRRLVRPLADERVGGVAGNQRYLVGEDQHGVAGGERRYWDLDRFLKVAESSAGHVISATGSLYAIRRDLFQEIPGGVTDDFTISTGVIERGRRLVFEPGAVAWEPVAPRGSDEFQRKVRVMTRGLSAVALRRNLLNPRPHGFYALQLFWHKVVRRTMAVPLLTLLVATVLLWPAGAFYRLALVAQVTLYVTGAAGILLPPSRLSRAKAVSLPAFFCIVNAAGLVAVWNLARGHRVERWDTRRPAPAAQPAPPGSHAQ